MILICQVCYICNRHLEIRLPVSGLGEVLPVILSAAKDLASLLQRSFAALRMTGRTSKCLARGPLALSVGSCHLLKLHKWPTVVSRHMAAYMRTPFLVTFMLYGAELMEL